MEFRVIGCGDAFGSGGRFNTCFQLRGETVNLLLDCGASSLIALKGQGVALNAIQAIVCTHFHADHFGGIPFFVLESQFFSRRAEPLVIAGPVGVEAWYRRYLETSFPGSSRTRQRFELSFVELEPGRAASIAGATVVAAQAHHGRPDQPPGGPFLSLRVEAEGKAVCYSGDTQWTDGLLEVSANADLFVAEAYFRDKPVPLHLDLATLEAHLPRITARRILLTHMSDDMLASRGDVAFQCAEDGLVVRL